MDFIRESRLMRKLIIFAHLALLGLLQTAVCQYNNGAYSIPVPNDTTTGTVLHGAAKINSAGNAIAALTTDTTVRTFVVVNGAGTSGKAALADGGQAYLTFDSAVASAANFFVVVSTVTANAFHATATPTCGAWVLGTMISNSTSVPPATSLVALSGFTYSCGSTGSGTVVASPVNEIAVYAGPGTLATVTGDANLTDSGGVLNYAGAITATSGQFGLPTTYASLTAAFPCASNAFLLAGVTDSTTQTPGNVIVGGGSFKVEAFCNGTNYVVAGGLTSTGPVYDCTKIPGATGEFSNDILKCQTLLSATGGTGDLGSEAADTTVQAIALTAGGIHYKLPPVVITLGVGFPITVSGNGNLFDCAGGDWSCIINAAGLGTGSALTFSGTSNRWANISMAGGRCGNVYPCPATPSGLTPQTENCVNVTGGRTTIENAQFVDCAQNGVQVSTSGTITVGGVTIKDSQILRSGHNAIEINNPSATALITNTSVLHNYVKDGNINHVGGAGSINVSNSGGTNCGTDKTLIQGNRVEFTTPPSNVLDTAAAGDYEGIQSQDNTCHTKEDNNIVFQSYYEGFVMGGLGGEMTNDTCDACGLLGAGAGAFMYSYSGAAGTVGDIVMANLTATNSTSSALGYCVSVQDNNTSLGGQQVTYQNINVGPVTCSERPGGGSYNIGARFTHSGGTDDLTLSNVVFHNVTVDPAVSSSFGFGYTSAAAGTGTVNTSGTAVTWVSGTVFNTGWTGTIVINSVSYNIATVNSSTSITLTATAGTQSGVAYTLSGNVTGAVFQYDNLPAFTPTSCAATGAGTAGNGYTCTFATGAGNESGTIIITTASTGTAGTGTVSLNFANSRFGPDAPACQFTPSNGGSGTWAALAGLVDASPANSSDVQTWTNGTGPTNLTASSTYWINYQCRQQ
jgi:hypothetical protein